MNSLKLTIPNLTQAQIDAITAPDTGEIVLNTTEGKLYIYNGTAWVTAEGNGEGLTFADVWAANTLMNC